MANPSVPPPVPGSGPGPAGRPTPPRRMALRLVAALLVLGVVMAGTQFVRVRLAERRLTDLVDSLRRQGEPMLPADFEQPTVPDAENAAADLRAAAASINISDPRFTAFGELNARLPLTDKEAAVIAAVLEANRHALAKAGEAFGKTGVDWAVQLRTPVIEVASPDLTQQYALARLLAAEALLAHHNGNDALAVRRLRQALFIARALDRHPLYVSHLSAIGIAAMASSRAGEMAPTLKVAVTPAAAPAADPATPVATAGPGATPAPADQVTALIHDLLNFDADNSGLVHGIRAERMTMLDSCEAVVEGKYAGAAGSGSKPGAEEWINRQFAKPALLADARLMIDYMSQWVSAAKAPNWPACRAALPVAPTAVDEHPSAHPLVTALLPTTGSSSATHYRCMFAVPVFDAEEPGQPFLVQPTKGVSVAGAGLILAEADPVNVLLGMAGLDHEIRTRDE